MEEVTKNMKALNYNEKLELLKNLENELKSKQKQTNQELSEQEKKQIAVEALLSQNISKTSKKYMKGESTMRYQIDKYCQDELKKEVQISKRRYKRSAMFLLMEVQVVTAIITQRNKKVCLSTKKIQQIAKEKFCNHKKAQMEEYKDKDFQASNRWLQKFCRRWQLSFRVSTHALSSISDDIYLKIAKNLKDFVELRLKQIQNNKKIILINLDEVPVFFDVQSSKTYDFK
ncbi:hypothetical protein ABPG72_012117 [Tetrahymena utriculariae]